MSQRTPVPTPISGQLVYPEVPRQEPAAAGLQYLTSVADLDQDSRFTDLEPSVRQAVFDLISANDQHFKSLTPPEQEQARTYYVTIPKRAVTPSPQPTPTPGPAAPQAEAPEPAEPDNLIESLQKEKPNLPIVANVARRKLGETAESAAQLVPGVSNIVQAAAGTPEEPSVFEATLKDIFGGKPVGRAIMDAISGYEGTPAAKGYKGVGQLVQAAGTPFQGIIGGSTGLPSEAIGRQVFGMSPEHGRLAGVAMETLVPMGGAIGAAAKIRKARGPGLNAPRGLLEEFLNQGYGIPEAEVPELSLKKELKPELRPRTVEVFHLSPIEGLTEIDPKFQGTGSIGAEKRRVFDEAGNLRPEAARFSNFYTNESHTIVEHHRFQNKVVYAGRVQITNKPGGAIAQPLVGGRSDAILKKQGYTGVYYPIDGQIQSFVPVPVKQLGRSRVGKTPGGIIKGDRYLSEWVSQTIGPPAPHLAERMVAESKLNEGGTFDPRFNYKPYEGKGFGVGGLVKPLVVDDITPDIIEQFATKHAGALTPPNRYLGTWLDEGKWHLDVSEVLDTEEAAHAAAHAREEKGIFDYERFVTIPTRSPEPGAAGQPQLPYAPGAEQAIHTGNVAAEEIGHRRAVPPGAIMDSAADIGEGQRLQRAKERSLRGTDETDRADESHRMGEKIEEQRHRPGMGDLRLLERTPPPSTAEQAAEVIGDLPTQRRGPTIAPGRAAPPPGTAVKDDVGNYVAYQGGAGEIGGAATGGEPAGGEGGAAAGSAGRLAAEGEGRPPAPAGGGSGGPPGKPPPTPPPGKRSVLAVASNEDRARQAVERLQRNEPDASFGVEQRSDGRFSIYREAAQEREKGAQPPLPVGHTPAPEVPEELSRRSLSSPVMKRATEAALEYMKANGIQRDPRMRVTEQVMNLIGQERVNLPEFEAALSKNGMNFLDFAEQIGFASSDAGRQLNYFKAFSRGLERMAQEGNPEAAAALGKLKEAVGSTAEARSRAWWDQLTDIWRKALITRVSTATRNALQQGATLVVDAFDTGLNASMQEVGIAAGQKVKDRVGVFDGLEQIWDVMRYTKTKAEANSILRAFPAEQDRLFQNYMSDLAANPTGKSPLLQRTLDAVSTGYDYANKLNSFQEYAFRRGVFVARLEARLRAKGMDLAALEAQGSKGLAKIPAEDVSAAVDKALQLTYATPPSGKAARAIARVSSDVPVIGRLVLPFPRWMINSTKWAFDHSPLAISKLLSANERAKLAAGDYEMFSKMVTGTALFGAALQLRQSEYAGEKWYEVKTTDGKIYDARPYYPFSMYLYVADLYVRHKKGTLYSVSAEDVAQNIASANVRGGAGSDLLQNFIDLAQVKMQGGGVAEKAKTRAAGYAGQVLGGFSTPLQNIYDVAAAMDPELAKQRDTRQRPLTGPTLARVPVESVVKTMPERELPTKEENPKIQNPLGKMATGFLQLEPKSVVQKELDRLQIDRRSYSSTTGYPEIDNEVHKVMGPRLDQRGREFIQSPLYLSKDNDWKRLLLQDFVAGQRSAATATVIRDNRKKHPDWFQKIKIEGMPLGVQRSVGEAMEKRGTPSTDVPPVPPP